MDTSYFKKFYDKSRSERIAALQQAGILSEEDAIRLEDGLALSPEIADNMIENQLSTYELPYGVALNFLIDGKDYAVPMAIEEPSVIAAASSAAKTIAQAGGFATVVQKRLMIGQVALKKVPDSALAEQTIRAHEADILKRANEAHPSIVKRGGGARKVSVRIIPADAIGGTPEFVVVHLHVETLEAMGANIINTMMEGVSPYLQDLTGGEALMGILSNYPTDCLATATCRIPANALAKGELSGEEVRDRLIEAYQFAYVDPYRAVTHNKGIMNGIDAVVLASGNDWRAISAGAHAYASRSGQYRSLSSWKKAENGDLIGSLTLPLPVGAVGGSISFHPAAKMTRAILGDPSAAELEAVIVSVGLAQNFSAIKALVTEGIQKGHMGLQSRSLAISAGATGEQIEWVSEQLKKEKNMNLATAKALLEQLKAE
ncbi:hydroxymethylglutaryl-coa reductase class i/ii [Trichococcus palustris]|jgi:hydroxymethylglutaryl-CoA reductase|uniref:3-hydroxy-3-methylglutaryl coenzyme A reductase n=1 Tax=Trichococcus palustris TaxID=140314 RepID=A0A143YLW3_9LACT|nr:hydroxymethylglutaryl-CoA reductase, degradative [Trichococcus palustris]CZQ93944.1 hydroxymethylglutaryl-coa reductase class i/ii [Trichococcus palustris]SFK82690.1 3-hydroxy-3-methylglutaryl-coenzyme A reductase [Trichococcus palustris]